MKISRLFPVLEQMIIAKRTVCLEGSPGIGKTTVPFQIAKKLGYEVQVVHLPTARVEDFGIPFLKDGNMEFSIPSWFPCKGSKHGPKGLLIFDDRNQADTNLQKALANIIQARELNGHTLLEDWVVLSTGNRCSDRSGAIRVLGHLRNRETVINVDVELDSWCEWAVQNGVSAEVVAFLNYCPNLLNNYDSKQDINATPRSWSEGVSQVLLSMDSTKENKMDDASRQEVFAGAVGEGPAQQFSSFLKLRSALPDFKMILERPETFKIDEKRGDLMYAVAVHIAYMANVQNIGKVIAVSKRMKTEYIVLILKIVVSKFKANKVEQQELYKNKDFMGLVKDYAIYIA